MPKLICRTNLVASYWLDFLVSRGFEKSNLRFLLKIFRKENLAVKGSEICPFGIRTILVWLFLRHRKTENMKISENRSCTFVRDICKGNLHL